MRSTKLSSLVIVCFLVIVFIVLPLVGCNIINTTTQPATPAGPLASYTLTVKISPSGSGTVSPPGGEYDSGLQITLTATPASGYEFDYWDGSVAGASNRADLTISSDKSVTAHFKPVQSLTSTTTKTTTPTTVTIPDMIGSWQGTMNVTDRPYGANPAGHFTWAINNQNGANFSGTFNITFGSMSWMTMAISGQFMDDGELYISYAVPRSATSWSFSGNVQGNSITGSWSGTGACAYSGTWQATRLGTSPTNTIPKLGQK